VGLRRCLSSREGRPNKTVNVTFGRLANSYFPAPRRGDAPRDLLAHDKATDAGYHSVRADASSRYAAASRSRLLVPMFGAVTAGARRRAMVRSADAGR
jgi:hypothetical protein